MVRDGHDVPLVRQHLVLAGAAPQRERAAPDYAHAAQELRLHPWQREESHPSDVDTSRDRLAYLEAKAALLDELWRAATELTAMARSLAEAGQWRAAEAELARVEELGLELRRRELAGAIARLRSTDPALETGSLQLRRHYVLPARDEHAPPLVRLLRGFFLALGGLLFLRFRLFRYRFIRKITGKLTFDEEGQGLL